MATRTTLALALLVAACGRDSFNEGNPTFRTVPDRLELRDTPVGQTSQGIVELVVDGPGAGVTVEDVYLLDDPTGFSEDFDERVTIRPGDTVEVTVTFAPIEPGSHSTSLMVFHSESNDDPRIPVLGLAVE